MLRKKTTETFSFLESFAKISRLQPSVEYHFQNQLEINTSFIHFRLHNTILNDIYHALPDSLNWSPLHKTLYLHIVQKTYMCYFMFMHSAVLCPGSVSINMKHIFYKLFDIQEKQMQIDGPHLHTRSKINYIYNYVWWLCAWAAWFSSILNILIVVMQQLSFIVSAVPVYLF